MIFPLRDFLPMKVLTASGSDDILEGVVTPLFKLKKELFTTIPGIRRESSDREIPIMEYTLDPGMMLQNGKEIFYIHSARINRRREYHACIFVNYSY